MISFKENDVIEIIEIEIFFIGRLVTEMFFTERNGKFYIERVMIEIEICILENKSEKFVIVIERIFFLSEIKFS